MSEIIVLPKELADSPEVQRLVTRLGNAERQRDQLLHAIKIASALLEKHGASHGHGCSYTARECFPEAFSRIDAAISGAEASHANNR